MCSSVFGLPYNVGSFCKFCELRAYMTCLHRGGRTESAPEGPTLLRELECGNRRREPGSAPGQSPAGIREDAAGLWLDGIQDNAEKIRIGVTLSRRDAGPNAVGTRWHVLRVCA